MNTTESHNEKNLRGRTWFDALTNGMSITHGSEKSLLFAQGELGGRTTHFILVQPSPENLYPRARNGEVGLLEGWGLAKYINKIITDDHYKDEKSSIIALVDVPSQAYGRREEALGIHQALAAAVSAYASARLAGHPLYSLLVGKAMSGAFLAHGYQANKIFALNDQEVMVHAMGKAAAARVTQRTEEQLEHLAGEIPPMAYDLENYASLGLLEPLIEVDSATNPTNSDVTKVTELLTEAIVNHSIEKVNLEHRYNGANRQATRMVRDLIKAEW
ncbi:MAG: biotin-independent malonate decarboxylase subunit gamma [Neptuniibacter sp.]